MIWKKRYSNSYPPLASRRKFRILWIVLALVLVSVKICHAQIRPALYTPAASLQASDHYVTTILFHWYTPGNGQRAGPWLPLEGRKKWSGAPNWWKEQVKQIMSANIDVIYVIVIPKFETQRINLFRALDELRAEGYDTPKVAPFLDPVITWTNQPKVDLATESGKDEFVGQYIRFFQQYFAASKGAYTDDYLARQANKPILNTWHVRLNCTNIDALTRADVFNRLNTTLATDHPYFTNGFVMVTTALKSHTFRFADEKVVQFQLNKYYFAVTYNGIRSVQLKGGYWDQNVRTPGHFLARNGGVNYRNAWNQVNRATTQRVYVESWNEYNEGSGLYAAQNLPDIAADNTSGHTDEWSTSADPYEYIKTTARGAAEFNDTPALDAQILWHNIPDSMAPGETRNVTIVVRNTGDESWTAASKFKLGQADADPTFVLGKRVLLDDSSDEIPIYGGIFRGRPKAFEVKLKAPAELGRHTTHWRMLQEGGAWFGEELTVPIEVREKTAATVMFSKLMHKYETTLSSLFAITGWHP